MMKDTIILGNFEVEKNGKRIKYRTEIATEKYYDAVILHMSEYYLARAPLSSYAKMKDDPISLSSIWKLWRKALISGTAIIALLENDTGEPEKLIGCNLTYISSKNDAEKHIKEKGVAFNKVLNVVADFTGKSKIFEKHGVDSYLAAFGLSVHPDYHGYQIGENILKSREPIAKKFGLKLSGTVFTADASKHLAEKLGYKTLAEAEYASLKVHGEFFFKDVEKINNEKSMKFMTFEYL